MQLQDFTNNQPTKHQWHDRQPSGRREGRQKYICLPKLFSCLGYQGKLVF